VSGIDPEDPNQLTEHFTLAEMIYSDTALAMGIDNTPNEDETDNLVRTAELLEEIRALCDDLPVVVSSGFRCDELNAAIGGAENSAHRYGLAADITIPEWGTPYEICVFLKHYLDLLGIDQLINESSGDAAWVHVGLCEGEPRCECLTINDAGTFAGIVA
jgi:zinc D-Ala-D-Ala carboxypeptidase